MPDHYHFHMQLKVLWLQQVERTRNGYSGSGEDFDPEAKAFLESINHRPIDLIRYAGEFVATGEPDFETFLMLAFVRRQFFLHEMGGVRSDRRIESTDLPDKSAHAGGFPWLARLIPKVRAKLRGELTDELLVCCSGDRAFFREHSIHPAEFFACVMAHPNEDEAVIDFVTGRSNMTGHS